MTVETHKPVVDQIFGDNRAPVDEVLAADFADLAARARALAARMEAETPSRVETEEEQIAVGRLITEARALAKEIDATRTSEGKPLLDAKRRVDAFFKDMAAILDRAEGPLRRAADDFTRRKEAERREIARRRQEEARRKEEEARRRAEEAKSADAAGRAAALAEQQAAQADDYAREAETGTKVSGGGVTASGRRTWEYEIEDYAAVDLNALKPFMDRKAVDAAIRSMVRIQKDQTNIPGVRVFETVKTQFRG